MTWHYETFLTFRHIIKCLQYNTHCFNIKNTPILSLKFPRNQHKDLSDDYYCADMLSTNEGRGFQYFIMYV